MKKRCYPRISGIPGFSMSYESIEPDGKIE
jgi:hypothetical protein